MIFNQKLFWLLLPCSLTSLSAISFSSSESSNLIQSKAEDKELSIEEELGIINKIASTTNFLEFGDSVGPKTLEELVKNYLKTTSGAKELSKRLTQHLIVNLIDGYANSKSAINDRLEGKLRTLRSTLTLSSLGDKERKEARFLFAGDENAYQNEQVLQKSRDIFEPVLNEVLDELNFDGNSKFDKKSDGDPLKVLFSGFWDLVLDDYLKYERPIPFKKLTWNYDTANRKEDIKKLFDDLDSSLPEKPSYHFPFISKESETKFKAFLEAIKEKTPASETLKKHSDNKDIDLIIPISSLVNGEYTSQFTASVLDVFRYLVSPISEEGWYEKHYEQKILREAKLEQERNCDQNENGIFEVSIKNISDKKITDLFCFKDKKINKEFKSVNDFVYLIQEERKSKEPSWILFKDKEGIHTLTYNSDIFDNNFYDDAKLKNYLIKHENFDLRGKLKKYLNKHFERLILSYWDKFFQQQQQQQQQVDKLSEFLLRDFFSKDLLKLRKALLRDYLDILRVGKKNILQTKLVGRFPYDLFQNKEILMLARGKGQTYDTIREKISYLENSFLLDPSKASRFSWALDSFLQVKNSFDKYSKSVDLLFNEQAQQAQQAEWENFKFFKFNNLVNVKQSSAVSKKIDSIKNMDLLDSVWISLLQHNKLAEVLFQDKIKKDVDYFDLENWKKAADQRSIDGIDKFKFKDGESLKNMDNLIFNYLHSQYIDLNKDLSIPQILEDFDFEKVAKNGESKDLKEFLEKTVKKFKSTFSSSSSDLSNGGVVTDLFTIKWLTKNNFENFRKHLRSNLKKDSLSGFLFSKKFSENDKCLPKTWDKKNIHENLELKLANQKSSIIFGNKGTKDEEVTCLVNSDVVNFAKVTTKEGEKILTGYKGLVNGNWKDFLPEDIVNILNKKTSLWKDTSSLISYIDETVNSDKKYQELIEKLKSLYPQKNWDFNSKELCQKFNFDWQNGTKASCLNTNSTSFDQKKELLKKYLQNEKILDKSESNSYNNWITDKEGNHLIKSTDGAHHQIYLVQIKYDDVKDEDSWKAYLKTIDSSYFFRELIRVAKDPKIHKQALVSQLNSENGSLKGFKTGDDRLKRLLGYSWLNLKN